MEELSREIHNLYCRNNPGMPWAVPWEQLPENIRESNCSQARAFVGYLAGVSCACSAENPGFPEVDALTADEIDAIARQVHAVWTAGKVRDGWVYGAVRNDAQKAHPLLHIAWDALPGAEKDKDRAIAHNILPLLRGAGLRAYRKPAQAGLPTVSHFAKKA